MKRKAFKTIIKKPDYKKLMVKNVLIVIVLLAFIISVANDELISQISYTKDCFLGDGTMDILYDIIREASLRDLDTSDIEKHALPFMMDTPITVELNGELLASSERSYSVFLWKGDEPITMSCPWYEGTEEGMQEISDYFAKTRAVYFLGYQFGYVYRPTLRSGYFDFENNVFYPGKVTVNWIYEVNEFMEEDAVFNHEIASYDFTPSDKSLIDGLEYVEFFDEVYDEETQRFINSNSDIYILMFNATGPIKNAGEYPYNEPDNPIQIRFDRTLTDSLYRFSLTIYVIAFVLVLLVTSLIITTIEYYRKKSVYDIFEYRRTTTAAMAHDLKTPLAITAISVENLQENIDDDKERAKYHANQIAESVTYLNKLVSDILDFSNAQYSEGEVIMVETDICQEIKDYIESIKLRLDAQNIKVSVDGELICKVDRVLWNQAIRNIIDNAVKYGCGDIKITIDKDKSVSISNPVESDIDDCDKLLKPFVKGEEDRGENSGSGLGLAIAESNLNRMGMTLHVTCVDKLFTVTIR